MGTEINEKYELVMKDLIPRFVPPKNLQRQKRYLLKGVIQTSQHKYQGLHLPGQRDGRIPQEFPSVWSGTTPTIRQDLQSDEVFTPEGVSKISDNSRVRLINPSTKGARRVL